MDQKKTESYCRYYFHNTISLFLPTYLHKTVRWWWHLDAVRTPSILTYQCIAIQFSRFGYKVLWCHASRCREERGQNALGYCFLCQCSVKTQLKPLTGTSPQKTRINKTLNWTYNQDRSAFTTSQTLDLNRYYTDTTILSTLKAL